MSEDLTTITPVKELLKDLKNFVGENDIKKNERWKKKELFNVFEMLNLRNNEAKLHSAFIAELLDPQGSHGQQDIFLKEFLNQLRLSKKIDFPDFSTSNAKISKEKHTGDTNDDYTEDRFIDIIIESADGKYAIAIKNKICTRDHYPHLLHYKNYLEKTLNLDSKHYTILYLTLHGVSLREDPRSQAEPEKPFWKNISYASDIKSWIASCIRFSENSPLTSETLKQYWEIINRLTTYQTFEERESQEQIINVLMTGENIRYAEVLVNQFDTAKQRIMDYKVTSMLEELNNDADDWEVCAPEILSEKGAGFWFIKETWEDKNICIHFTFDGDNYRQLSYGIYRLTSKKEWDKQLFNKFTKIDNNWWDGKDDNCPFWKNIDGIDYWNQLPIECFSKPDEFVRKIINAVLELAAKIDDILDS